jgi:hypothetical protein
MIKNLTSPEKVLYKATYDFAISIERLNHVQATACAIEKVNRKRSLANKLTSKH